MTHGSHGAELVAFPAAGVGAIAGLMGSGISRLGFAASVPLHVCLPLCLGFLAWSAYGMIRPVRSSSHATWQFTYLLAPFAFGSTLALSFLRVVGL